MRGGRETHGGVHIGFEMDELPDEGFGNGRCLAICVSANLLNYYVAGLVDGGNGSVEDVSHAHYKTQQRVMA